MIKVGLTGSKFSGKNFVIKEFRNQNIKVFDADIAIKYLLNYNIEVIYAVQRKFGDKSVENLYINKSYFSTDSKMRQLLTLIESELFTIWQNYLDKNKNEPYVIFKCSCLIEMRWHKKFDKIINVFCKPQTAKDRNYFLFKKTNTKIYDLTKEMDIYEKAQFANIQIHNYEPMNIPKQVRDANDTLLSTLKNN